MRVVDVGDGFAYALAEIALLVAVAQLDASCSPVEAPEGTAARPIAPPRTPTSTSTVGLPRESSTLACVNELDLHFVSSSDAPRRLPSGAAALYPRREMSAQATNAASDSAKRFSFALVLVGLGFGYSISFGPHGVEKLPRLRATLTERADEAYERIVRNREVSEQIERLRTDDRLLEVAGTFAPRCRRARRGRARVPRRDGTR